MHCEKKTYACMLCCSLPHSNYQPRRKFLEMNIFVISFFIITIAQCNLQAETVNFFKHLKPLMHTLFKPLNAWLKFSAPKCSLSAAVRNEVEQQGAQFAVWKHVKLNHHWWPHLLFEAGLPKSFHLHLITSTWSASAHVSDLFLLCGKSWKYYFWQTE